MFFLVLPAIVAAITVPLVVAGIFYALNLAVGFVDKDELNAFLFGDPMTVRKVQYRALKSQNTCPAGLVLVWNPPQVTLGVETGGSFICVPAEDEWLCQDPENFYWTGEIDDYGDPICKRKQKIVFETPKDPTPKDPTPPKTEYDCIADQLKQGKSMTVALWMCLPPKKYERAKEQNLVQEMEDCYQAALNLGLDPIAAFDYCFERQKEKLKKKNKKKRSKTPKKTVVKENIIQDKLKAALVEDRFGNIWNKQSVVHHDGSISELEPTFLYNKYDRSHPIPKYR